MHGMHIFCRFTSCRCALPYRGAAGIHTACMAFGTTLSLLQLQARRPTAAAGSAWLPPAACLLLCSPEQLKSHAGRRP